MAALPHLALRFRCTCRTEFEVYRRIPQTETCPECEKRLNPVAVINLTTGKRVK